VLGTRQKKLHNRSKLPVVSFFSLLALPGAVFCRHEKQRYHDYSWQQHQWFQSRLGWRQRAILSHCGTAPSILLGYVFSFVLGDGQLLLFQDERLNETTTKKKKWIKLFSFIIPHLGTLFMIIILRGPADPPSVRCRLAVQRHASAPVL
jgi:hypothetical protein